MTSQLAKDAQNEKLTLANYLAFLNTHETVTELPDGGRMKVTVRMRVNILRGFGIVAIRARKTR